MAVRALLLQQFRRVNNSSVCAEFCFFMFWTSQGKVAFKQHPLPLFLFLLYHRSCGCWRCHLLLSNPSYLVISISCFPAGLQHEGIFRVSGSQVEVNDIKNAFERGKEQLFHQPRNCCQMWGSVWALRTALSAAHFFLCLWFLCFLSEALPNTSLVLINLEFSLVCCCALYPVEWLCNKYSESNLLSCLIAYWLFATLKDVEDFIRRCNCSFLPSPQLFVCCRMNFHGFFSSLV